MNAFYLSIALSLTLVRVAGAAANLDQAADDACQCVQEPYAQMEQVKGVVQQAMASGDYSRLMKLEGDFAGLQDRAMSCYNDLKVKYPEIDSSTELRDQVVQRMRQKCPAPQFGFGAPQQ